MVLRVSRERFLVFEYEKENHTMTFSLLEVFRQPSQRMLDLKFAHRSQMTTHLNLTWVGESTFRWTPFCPFMKLLHVKSSFVGCIVGG
jgi:hypothetical protein